MAAPRHLTELPVTDQTPPERGDAARNRTLLVDADYVRHQLAECGLTLQSLGDAWGSVARKLCGA